MSIPQVERGARFPFVQVCSATVGLLLMALPVHGQLESPLRINANDQAVGHVSLALDSASSTAETPAAVAGAVSVKSVRPDRNRSIYHKNKLEVSFESGYLPIGIPFVFDFLLGDRMMDPPRPYTLVPNIVSLRWQMNNLSGPFIFRGNWESFVSASATIIPRGPETRYFAYNMGIRRYFVQRNWPVVPYMEGRLGVGNINAGEPRGIPICQGQNTTFTLMIGSGFRVNVNQQFALWGGVTYMHVSNLYLSEPKYPNYGINVLGPLFGIDMTLRLRHREVVSDTSAAQKQSGQN